MLQTSNRLKGCEHWGAGEDTGSCRQITWETSTLYPASSEMLPNSDSFPLCPLIPSNPEGKVLRLFATQSLDVGETESVIRRFLITKLCTFLQPFNRA